MNQENVKKVIESEMNQENVKKVIERASAVIFECAKKHDCELHRAAAEMFSPGLCRTLNQNAVFLEFYYGVPMTFWTPLGEYTHCVPGLGEWDFGAASEVLQRLGAEPYRNKRTTSSGIIGPVVRITEIDGVSVEELLV